jgi:regulator of PEP synthase PpsR (kinase-PPPase family)
MKKKKEKKKVIPEKKVIYLVGEGTGETINKIARAALVQFSRERFEVKNFFMVKDKQYLSRITKYAVEDRALIAFSVIEPSLRDFLIEEAQRLGLTAIDVIGDFIMHLSIFLGEQPMSIPGRQYILDEDYFRRIDAINFAVKHDDGKYPQGMKAADIILVGLSRTGKTPLSTYLANQGWKVANVPIHPDMDSPQELLAMDKRKVFGLVISVESLVKLREARLEQLGLMPYAKYADPIQVAEEIEWCSKFFKKHPRWKVIDVSNKAIEEVSACILRAYQTWAKSH